MIKSKKTLLAAALLVVMLVLAGGYMKSVNAYQRKVQALTFSGVDLTAVKDGEYIGECNVGFISSKVKVTVKSGKIVTIDLLKHDNGKGKPAETILDEMIKQQTTDVDAISGATNSSKVLRKAVENALRSG